MLHNKRPADLTGEPRYMASPDINAEDFRAAVASTMYDMTRVNAKEHFDSEDSADARYAKKAAMNAHRTADLKNGNYVLGAARAFCVVLMLRIASYVMFYFFSGRSSTAPAVDFA